MQRFSLSSISKKLQILATDLEIKIVGESFSLRSSLVVTFKFP